MKIASLGALGMSDYPTYIKTHGIIYARERRRLYYIRHPNHTQNENLVKLEEFINKYNKLPSAENKDKNIKYLGGWLSNQKHKYKNNKHMMKDEEIRKQWEEFIEKYKELF
jgi:hypothetical protein